MNLRQSAIILTLAAIIYAAPALAGEFSATVKDSEKNPVKNAVVVLTPVSGKAPDLPEKPPTAIMDQVDKEYKPYVLPVRTGTEVLFPNSDNILHHVYSFSKAKPFELPLYKGEQANPVVFDNPGVVVLGCNIHDWMKGYIVVLDSPWFAKTGEDGAALIKNLPPGEYETALWHPDIESKGLDPAGKISVAKDTVAKKEFTIKLKAVKKKSKAPDPTGIIQY